MKDNICVSHKKRIDNLLIVFGIIALLLPVISMLCLECLVFGGTWALFSVWSFFAERCELALAFLFAAGLLSSFYVIPKNTQGRYNYPMCPSFFLGLLSLGLAMIWWIFGQIVSLPRTNILSNGFSIHLLCVCLAVLGSGMGITGLFRARSGAPVWQGVYILGMTLVTLVVYVLSLFNNLGEPIQENWYQPHLLFCVLLTVTGAIVTILSLISYRTEKTDYRFR